MKKVSWYVLAFTFLGIGVGLGISILSAYAKAYVFGGIEEETVGIFVAIGLLIFAPLGLISGKLAEKRWG